MSWSGVRHTTGSTALVVTLLLPVASFEAQASTIVYTDRAAFNAAAGPTTLLTFNPVVCGPLPDFPSFYCRANYGLLTVVYDSVLSAGSLAPPHILYGAGPYKVGTQLTQPVTAIGFDITPQQPQIQFDLYLFPTGGPVGTFTLSAPSFLGFLSTDAAFSAFNINHYHCVNPLEDGACNFTIDNMALRVPEPGTFSLFVPGLLMLWSMARARKERRSRSCNSFPKLRSLSRSVVLKHFEYSNQPWQEARDGFPNWLKRK